MLYGRASLTRQTEAVCVSVLVNLKKPLKHVIWRAQSEEAKLSK